MDPFGPAAIGDTGLHVTRLGFGSAALGRPNVPEDVAAATVQAAWDHGIRHFDSAPMYDNGECELRLGRALAGIPRDQYVLSTKVGRLVPGYEVGGPSGDRWEFDFSADATRRSIEHSLARLGVDRIDVLLIHDADDHFDAAVTGAYPVLDDLRRQGVVGAIGIGMTVVPWPLRFVRETDIDVLLLAGRYSLLDLEAASELFPACQARGVAVWNAQSLHGGLIEGQPNPRYHYQPVDPATQAKVETIREICSRHGVPTAAAAIQFPLAHPAVAEVLTGPSTPEQLEQNTSWAAMEIPQDVWDALRETGILNDSIPIPAAPAASGGTEGTAR